MTPREKAEAVVVAGMPAGDGFGGVLVRQWNTERRAAARALVFADQEGGTVKTFRALAPWRAASQYRSAAEAFRAGRETAAALRRAGVHATFAPVLDLADGPLGSRQFAKPEYGVAFARGLGQRRVREALPRPRLDAEVDRRRARLRRPPQPGSGAVPRRDPRRRPVRDGRARDLPAARAAPRLVRAEDVRAAARGSASAASRSPTRIGVLGSPYAPFWARLALRAGADMVLTTSARDAQRIVDALLPLARAGELDAKLVRVSRYRRAVAAPSR